MEKHFFLLPLVLWWPPLSHFRKKGIFPHTEKWALTMAGVLLLL